MAPIYVSDPGGSDFQPAPEGTWLAVCCDVTDLGMVDGQWGEKHKVRIRWQLDDDWDGGAGKRDDGKPWMIQRSFTASLHEKSALRKFLESWRNKRFTDDELKKFDVEALIGVNCQLQVLHQPSADQTKVWANVHNIMPAPKGVAKLAVKEYARDTGAPGPNDPDDDQAPF